MSLTREIREELAQLPVTKADLAATELAVMLRLAGGLNLVGGRILVEAEVDSSLVMERIREYLKHMYRVEPQVISVSGGALRKGDRYVIRVVKDAETLARRCGLLDLTSRPIRGLSPSIVRGGREHAAAAWRGAVLVRGSLMEPGRAAALEVTCPGHEAAMGLVGMARTLGAHGKAKEARSANRVMVRDSEAISTLIRAMGASRTYGLWQERRQKREARRSANRLANFDDANLRRSARAAVTAGARVQRAFEILGDDTPEHLRAAGELRMKYQQASLEELGMRSNPPLTKDAVAGRIRRLLAKADKVAAERGIPDTEAVLTGEMLQDE